MEDGNGSQVRRTSGESFATSTGRMDVQHSDKNKDIGSEDDQKCTHLVEGGEAKEKQVGGVCIGAWDSNKSSVFTEKAVDHLMSRKVYLEGIAKEYQWATHAPEI